MRNINASVGILTFNSEETLERTLDSVKNFNEIIICDGGSVDRTLEIAKSYGVKIIEQSNDFKNSDNTLRDYSGVRNQCLDNAIYDWFLYVDSDEMVDQKLIEEIEEIVNGDGDILVYNISPRIIYEGKLIEYSSNYPGWQKRFFNRKSGARFIKTVHERIDFKKTIKEGYLKGHWNYFASFNDSYKKLDKYAKMETIRSLKDGKSLIWIISNRLNIALKIFLKSMYNYIFHGFKKTMPIKGEWSRIWHNILAIKWVLILRNGYKK